MGSRRRVLAGITIVVLLVVAGAVVRNQIKVRRNREIRQQTQTREAGIRQTLFDLLRPVQLANCRLERFGEPHDGGYLMCGNLLDGVRAGYSYGIGGYDQWGCQISTKLKVRVHQYDCFNPARPVCAGGDTVFHDECVGSTTRTEEGRLFDTIENQLSKNGDLGRPVVLKIDVEGAEWDSFFYAPAHVLEQIDQMAVEFHDVPYVKAVQVVGTLKQIFHVAHIHFNNAACVDGLEPFTSAAYEVLFVSKRLGVVAPAGPTGFLHPLDAPNDPSRPDCQPAIR